MRKLIVDLMGLEDFEHLEACMDFYPDGLKGLIADYLTHYYHSPNLHEEDERDAYFFRHVLDQYDASPQAELDSIDGGTLAGVAVTIMLYAVAATVKQIVQLQKDNLRHAFVDLSLMDWGRDYVTVPMRS